MAQSFIYGFHAVTGRLRQNPKGVTEIYFDQGRQDPRGRELLKLAESQRVRIVMVDRPRLDRIVGHDKHQGVVARVEVQTEYHDVASILENLTEPPLLLVLDGVQDPHNLGACLRTADAMGVHAVVAPKDRAVGLNPTVRKVACGAAETVPFVMVTNLARTLKELKEYDIWVVGADGGADTDLPAAKLEGPLALVLGAEGEGLRRLTKETCDQLVRIPMFGTVESLNVSVASGMCLYEARRQRGGVTRLA